MDAGCTNTSYAACETWAHQNRLGSVVAVSDAGGAVVDKFTYSSYGVSGGSASGFPFRFTGQKLDPETGLYYYKARYYDPETGRFLQTDPIGYEDQMNLYAYVRNDPINGIDPTGEAAFFVTRPCCLPGQNHSFVIVTDGDSITDPIVARYSFGPEKPGGRGALTNRTGTGDATDRGDIATVDRIQSGDTDGISITQIDASDDTVIAVGDAAIGNPDYDPVPGAIGRPDGANSNSAAVAISRRSAEIDGSTFDPPDDVTLTGAEYDELVEFDEDRLPK